MWIDRYRFGRVRIDGTDYTDDVIILGGVVISPWWRSAGSHVFAPEDLANIIDSAPGVVCLGTGAVGMVRVADETLAAFEAAGTEVVQGRTGDVIKVFNRLASEDREIAAALHLTC